ncbi:MAG: methyltransferase domain-containing protein [Chloroflexi bacterium]|nr:methyltransferase domain-containing protein [Chloroflexota bacterium]
MASVVEEAFREWAPTYDETFVKEVEQYGSIKYADLMMRLLESMELAGGERVLDVATGTGAIAIAAAKRVGPAGKVVGVDITPAMLERATQNVKAAGLEERIELHHASAMALPFPDEDFDVVVSSMAMHHTVVEDALAEMVRVLKPGGRLVITDMGASPAWRTGSGKVVVRLLLFFYQLSRGFSAQARAEGLAFTQTYTIAEWRAWLERFGLSDIEIHDFPHPTERWYPVILLMRSVKSPPAQRV